MGIQALQQEEIGVLCRVYFDKHIANANKPKKKKGAEGKKYKACFFFFLAVKRS
jgi:hypothetical protein